MHLFIYYLFALLALSSAKQIQNGPQILSEESSSSEPSQTIDKRSVKQQINLYFTPEKVQALQAVKSSLAGDGSEDSIETLKQNPEIIKKFYNELIQKYYAENLKPAPIEEPQVEPARSLSNFHSPREESVYYNKPNYRQLLLDQTKLSGHAQNVPKNKYNQFASPSGTDSGFFNLPSSVNRNEDQRTSGKELEYFLKNFQIDQPKQFNFPTQVRIQNSERNVDQKKSSIEKEIENAWRQHQTFEFERSNLPADIIKQSISLSASNENPENTEEQKQNIFILRNGQAYGFERLNDSTEVNNQFSQDIKDLYNESEVKREIEKLWRKQQDAKIQRSFFSSMWNANKGKSGADKLIGNTFRPQAFVYDKLNSLPFVNYPNPSSRIENQDKTEAEKLIELFFTNRQGEFERINAPELNSESPLNENQNKANVEKQIQNILKKHQDFEFQRSKSAAETNSQRPGIKINDHTFFTKHVPVPVLETVQVSVPTPVPVPIPQPYEVKVPHLYPVHLNGIKHVPISLVRHY